MRMPRTQILVSKYPSLLKEPGLLVEMVDAMGRAGKLVMSWKHVIIPEKEEGFK